MITSTLSKLHIRTGMFVANSPKLNFQVDNHPLIASYFVTQDK